MRAQENARPSRNFGNSSATAASRARSDLSTAGFSFDASLTPTSARCAKRFSFSPWKRASVTMTPFSSGNALTSGTKKNGSSMNCPPLISGMEVLPVCDVLEGDDADAAIGVQEALARFAQVEISADYALDRVHDLVAAEGGAEDLADARILRARAAELELVELHALLVDALDADMSGMMMAAGVDAAADLDLELADIVLAAEIGETLRDLLRDGNRARIGEVAIVQTWAGDDVGDEPCVGCGQAELLQPRVHLGQVAHLHMRQDQVLLVADADLGEAVRIHQICERVHLRVRRVARHAADGLQGDRRDGVARRAVSGDVRLHPVRERCVAGGHLVGKRLEGGRREIGVDAVELRARQLERATFADLLELHHRAAAHLFGAERVGQDLDARLVEIVAAPFLVVDAHHAFEEGEDVLFRHEFADRVAQIGRAPHAAADEHLVAGLTRLVAHDLDGHVVELERGAIVRAARHRDLELARQERELGMQRRPLADDLGDGARILDLVRRRAREVIGGDVADAVAARLDRVHLDASELGKDIGHVDEPRPVELDVLPRGEVAVALVVFARDVGEHAQLPRVQRPVRHRYAQHVGMELQIEPVHQPKRLELVLGQLARKPARNLAAELLDALGDEPRVEFVISIHRVRPFDPPLEGGSKSAQQISGRGAALYPSPKNPADFSTLPQGEGWPACRDPLSPTVPPPG